MFPFGAMLEIEITGGLLLPGHLNVIKHGLWPGVVRAGFELRGDGALRSFDINGTLVNYDAFWMDLNARTPAIGDLYEARVTDTMIGGSDPFFPGSSAVGSWIQMTGGGPIWFLWSGRTRRDRMMGPPGAP